MIMDLKVIRRLRTEKSTIGDLYIDGVKKYHTLEDVDRGLHSDMTLAEIAAIKVKTKTAVPTGKYNVTKFNSPKHGWCLLVNHVPGFNMIEIHAGNYAEDTDGCLLVGLGEAHDMVTSSKVAIAELYALVFPILEHGGEVWITYE